METATEDDIAELLGERADEAVVVRIANLNATIDEIAEALDDLDHEVRFGETRIAATPKIEEIRSILEELPREDLGVDTDRDEDDEHEGLTVMEADELGAES